MSFLEILAASAQSSFPGLLYWLVFPMVPFIIAEQLRPVATAPKLRDYWMNLLISISTAYLSLPLGISAALLSGKLRLFVDLKLAEAGKAARYSTMFLVALSMFYHSAIRIRLPWLDYFVVTPQVYRIHHSALPEHRDKNFADALPVFDIVFGTFERPKCEEFPPTGLGPESSAPRSLLAAQFGPLLAVGGLLRSIWDVKLRPRRASG